MTSLIRTSSQGRVGLLDEARGFAILCMVVYHGFYDLVYIFGIDIPLFYSPLMRTLQAVFAGLFIFISGSACAFSKSNLKRGALCFGLGMLLTLGTFLFMSSELILFGILHMLGICMMLYPLADQALRRIPKWLGIVLLALLFVGTYSVSRGGIGFLKIVWWELPPEWYQQSWLFWLGFPDAGFSSSDYFPLLPWMFLFFLGSYFGKALKEQKMPRFFYRTHLPPLAFIGRNTLLIYLIHQPVIYGVMWVVFFLLQAAGVYTFPG